MEARRAVLLAVYDVSGALVKTLVNGSMPGGRHEARWDGLNERGESVASGIYFVQLRSDGYTNARKMVLLR
jgi:flagellar hook assembly protein FlgD